ncbi:cytochrome c maturation protein CcmE [Couchioplanes caeruleus]|uniref:cytochrome c maturation protein CcmE n=1 Tax=Couchioplanes caeruleus TaxID=56438 RepID=UPI0020BE126A|nr:cytochrome c maturation protein CcmE [Couchioplanes caeruleus]UQU62624.1 cytochrome c maturation protein CcmE [Couchioplanes caeruleus]
MSARRSRALLLLLVVAGVALLVTAGLQNTLTFYRSPSEITQGPAAHDRVRLGGEVVPGSLRTDAGVTRFRISDGTTEIPVEQVADLPGTLREGQQAVVEGSLDDHGVFRSDTVMAKHGNEYRPAEADGQDSR